MTWRTLFGVAVLAGCFASSAFAQDPAAAVARQSRENERAREVETAATDPSLRSPIATPKAELIAEIAEDKKRATAKMGLELRRGLTAELGFTGAFDKSAERSRITSLRALSAGSTGWFALTKKKYRIHFDWQARNVICRQVAWAAGERFQDFECQDEDLPAHSFAERLAELAANPSAERAVCQQFHRAVMTGADVSAGKDFAIDCELASPAILKTRHAAIFTASYESRYAEAKIRDVAVAKTGGPADAARAICNEFRRSRGWPMDAKCNPDDLDEASKADFAKTWEERFSTAREQAEADICDEYRRARGELPTDKGGCQPSKADPLFDRSFQDRYLSTYRSLATPIVSLKGEMGRSTFKYRDADLAKQQETQLNYAVTGTLGVLTATDVLYALNYSLGRSFKAGDPIELCQPVPDRAASTCEADVILSGPKQEDRHQLELQLKRYLSADVGAQLFITRDLKIDAWGFEVPVYFIKNAAGGLAGGLVMSYRTDKKAFEASVFIGQVFGMFD